MVIAGRRIGPDAPPFVIAELSGNHLGQIDRALKAIETAARCGADAVKFQTYTPDTLTIDVASELFKVKGGLWDGQSLHQLYASAYTPYEWHERMFRAARDHGLIAFSTPFDSTAVQLLSSLEAPAYKIASFEIVDLPLIAEVARQARPMIISTGIANFTEIAEAATAARENGCRELALLHCTSGYPTPFADCNLRTMPHLAQSFEAVPGLSDHTPGTAAAVAAVALGACIIEKHFTLARADGGPDAAFSLEPDELQRLVHDCRAAYDAIGEVSYSLKGSERGSLVFRRSLFVVEPVAEGEALTASNVRSIRPGHGLAPKHLPEVIGRRARRALERGEPLSWEMIA